jgi:hypothetical protein
MSGPKFDPGKSRVRSRSVKQSTMTFGSVVEVDPSFRGPLIMEEVRTSETSVDFSETTQRCTSEGCDLYTRHCGNLKSHVDATCVAWDTYV